MSGQDFNQERLDEIEQELNLRVPERKRAKELMGTYIGLANDMKVIAGECEVAGDDKGAARYTKKAERFNELVATMFQNCGILAKMIKELEVERREVKNVQTALKQQEALINKPGPAPVIQEPVLPEKKEIPYGLKVAGVVAGIVVAGVAVFALVQGSCSSQSVQNTDQAEQMYGE